MGDAIPQWKGTIFVENVAAHCKVMGHSTTTVSCAKTAEPIEMPLWIKTRVSPRNYVLNGVQILLKGKGQFRGLSGPFKNISRGRCSGRCGVRCKRDNSIANNVMQQKGSFSMPGTNSILKISGPRRCVLSAAKGDCTARAKSDIYDCLVYTDMIQT